MGFLSWCKLVLLEQKLYHGEFGKYNRYRCWCLERNAKTARERLSIAKEVLEGPGVNTMEAQYNELYLRRTKASRQRQDTPIQSTPPEDTSAQKTEPQHLSRENPV